MNIISGITKIGEGYSNPEGIIPIDIHYHKLLEWLIDRKKVPPTWKKQLKPISLKLEEALKTIPETSEIHSFVKDKSNFILKVNLTKPIELNYFDCVRVMELLVEKENEPTTKTMFGSYTSKRMQEWNEVIKLYEKDNTFLAEAAHTLITLANFEVPSLKKVIEQSQRQISELNRKETEWHKTLNAYKTRFQHQCSELGIEGKEIKKELQQKVKEIPQLLEEVLQSLKESNIEEIMNLYTEFLKYTVYFQKKNPQIKEQFPVLRYVLQYGNEPLHFMEKRNKGEDPTATLAKKPAKESKSETQPETNASALEIDWTVIEEEAPAASSAPQDNTAKEGSSDAPITIDWDVIPAEEPTTVVPAEGGIVWDVDTTEEAVDTNVIEVVGAAAEMETVTIETSAETETILENTETRNKFIDEIMERKAEMEYDDASAIDLFQSAPAALQQHTVQTITGYLSAIDEVIAKLQHPKLRNLLEIKSSKRYVDRLTASLHKLLECIDKSNGSLDYSNNKKQELNALMKETRPQLDQLISKIKELKGNIEQSLSKQYNGRPVNIIGEINNW